MVGKKCGCTGFNFGFVEQLGGTGFSAKPQRYWSIKNMRALLETCAKQRGLDPLLPQSWYSIGERDIRRLKVRTTMFLEYFSRNEYIEYIPYILQ
jgi:hypothetical protein